jgi:preprotein translocase subunit SecE
MAEEKSWMEKVTGWPVAVKNYAGELHREMRMVTWPSWKQVRATTSVVIAAVFAFAAYFAVVDLLIGRALTKVFDTFSK